MTTEHTPLPWDVSEQEWGDGPIYVVQFEHPDFTVSDIATAWTKDSHERPDMPLPAKANAEYIVRACNAYPELVAALEAIAKDIYNTVDGPDGSGVYAFAVSRHAEALLSAALAKARGEAS